MRILPTVRRLVINTTLLNSIKFSVQALNIMSPSSYAVRRGEIADLPQIYGLIGESYAALKDYFPDPDNNMEKEVRSVCEGELSPANFEKNYFSTFGYHFWVVEECGTTNVLGCVGLRRHTADSAELCRMAVNPSIRGQGLGNLLLKQMDIYCGETGVLQVTLSTANPRAGNFYAKCGFVNLSPTDSWVMRMVKYFGERVIRKVAIVGGTHGNERIGVELVRQWAADGCTIKRPSFETTVVLGNPLAIEANSRYVKDDMNRQFSGKDTLSWKGSDEVLLDGPDSIEVQVLGEEALHARKLNELLGPKGAVDEGYQTDFIIDLHSSVSNVGLMGMINGADKDTHAVRLSQYLLEERKEDFPNLKITNSKGSKGETTNVDSISPYGIAFEVGPITHGTLSSKLLEETRRLVHATLDFIEAQNKVLILSAAVSDGGVYTGTATADRGVVRSLGRDIVLASTPATREVICKVAPFQSIDCYVEVAKINYPIDERKEPSSLPSLHPTTSCIHPQLEGKDWAVIEDGQPAFISTDGLNTVTPFTAPPVAQGHRPSPTPEAPPVLYPIFINEASYQQSGVAFAVYKKVSKVVP